MTSELQERIAKAICDFDCEGTGLSWANSPWEERPEWVRKNCMSIALVAMKAARGANTRMLAAAQAAWRDDPAKRTSTLWDAMLDAEIAAAEGGENE